VSKHIKLWAMNAFNEWRLIHGFDMAKSISNLFEYEGLIKDLVDMLSSFVLQVAKKDGSLYPPTMYNFLPFFECLYNWVSFFFIMCFSCFCLVYASTSYVFLYVIRFRVYVKVLGFRFRVYFKVLSLRFMFWL